MEYKVTNEQLLKVFSTVMSEYSDLEVAERSYDYWDQERGRYADVDVDNYYRDVEEDYEDDSWILQVQYQKGDIGEGKELPILRYGEWWFRNVMIMFGNHFEHLLGEWFNATYPVKTPIKTVTKEQD